jgi:broad specificity phosphatase PhoE
MSQLVLVRHGQAAAFTADSDRLTELGERQARELGRWLATRGTKLDEVYVGTLRRQRETARLVGEALMAARLPFPEPREHAGWNEYDAGGINGRLGRALAERDAGYAALVADFERNAGARDRNRYFQRMFEALMERWVSGEASDEGVESFTAFHARVKAARDAILAQDGSRNVMVFTSGGPIGVCVQLALGAPERMAVQVNWRVKNGSMTEMLFSKDRLSLDSFNAIPHLDSKELQSFR